MIEEKIRSILSKPSLEETDIKFLMEHVSILPDHGLVRLGLKEASVERVSAAPEPAPAVHTEAEPEAPKPKVVRKKK